MAHYVALGEFAVILTALNVMAERSPTRWLSIAIDIETAPRASIFLLVTALLFAAQPVLYNAKYEVVWASVQASAPPTVLLYVLLILAVFIATALIKHGVTPLLGSLTATTLQRLRGRLRGVSGLRLQWIQVSHCAAHGIPYAGPDSDRAICARCPRYQLVAWKFCDVARPGRRAKIRQHSPCQ